LFNTFAVTLAAFNLHSYPQGLVLWWQGIHAVQIKFYLWITSLCSLRIFGTAGPDDCVLYPSCLSWYRVVSFVNNTANWILQHSDVLKCTNYSKFSHFNSFSHHMPY
jgi:hypothetical protein